MAASNYSLVSFPRFSSRGATIRRHHFHDAAGSDGRLLLQTPADNVFERFRGLYVWAGEQIYMGGTLGLQDVSLTNTTAVDGGGGKLQRWTAASRCALGSAT